MFYNNTIAMIRSLDGDTEFFDVVVGVLKRDILVPIGKFYIKKAKKHCLVWFGLVVLWLINPCGLFNAKSFFTDIDLHSTLPT